VGTVEKREENEKRIVRKSPENGLTTVTQQQKQKLLRDSIRKKKPKKKPRTRKHSGAG
jgi:hypothetical protein